ncbi:hypothetical protein AB0Q92_15955, partial [Streptomyces sp. NPDC088183]
TAAGWLTAVGIVLIALNLRLGISSASALLEQPGDRPSPRVPPATPLRASLPPPRPSRAATPPDGDPEQSDR